MKRRTDKDYYKILGVPSHAPLSEIRRRYHRLAKRYHPDRVSEEEKEEATEQFKEINEAYETLSDTVRRGHYDLERLAAASHAPAPQPPPVRPAYAAPPRGRVVREHFDETPLYRLFDMLAFAFLVVGGIAGLPLLFIAAFNVGRLNGVAELLAIPANLGLWIFLLRAYLRRSFVFSEFHVYLYPLTAAALAGLSACWSELGLDAGHADVAYACRHMLRVEFFTFALSWSGLALLEYFWGEADARASARLRAAVAALVLLASLWHAAAPSPQKKIIKLVQGRHDYVSLEALFSNARIGHYKAYMVMAGKPYAPARCLERILDACVPLSSSQEISDTAYHCRRAVLSASENANTPQYYLDKLSDSEIWRDNQWGERQKNLKLAMARNISATYSMFLKYSADQDPDIRRAVIENPAVPLDILRRLSRDPFQGNGEAAQKLLKETD